MKCLSDLGYTILTLCQCVVIVLAGWVIVHAQWNQWPMYLRGHLAEASARVQVELEKQFDHRFVLPRKLAADPLLVQGVGSLLDALHEGTALRRVASTVLRARLAAACSRTSPRGSDFFIITLDGITLTAQGVGELGSASPFVTRAKFLARLGRGKQAFVVLRPAAPAAGDDRSWTYVGVPIKDPTAKVIAGLVCAVEPLEPLLNRYIAPGFIPSPVFYVLDASGRPIRFAARYRNQVLGRLDGRGGPDPLIRSSGDDIGMTRARPEAGRKWALARMARFAATGGGVNVQGYQDQRGEPVAGAWVWNEEYGSVVVVEQNVAQAYRPLYKRIAAIVLVCGFVIAMLLLMTRACSRARRRIAFSEQRFRDMLVAGSDWFWETGADLRYTYMDERFSRILDIAADSYIGKTPDEVRVLGLFNVASPNWARQWGYWTEHQPFKNFHCSVVKANGRKVYLSSSGRPYQDKYGCFAGFRGTTRNITREFKVVRTLRNQKMRLDFLLEHIKEGVYLHDGRVLVDANPVGAMMLGYCSYEIIGRNLIDFTGTHGYGELRCMHKRENLERYEVSVLGKDGETITLEISSSRVYFQRRHLWVTVARDIRRRKAQAAERKVHDTHNAFLWEMAVEANECEEVSSFLRVALERWCAILGWPLGHARVLITTSADERGKFVDHWFPAQPGVDRSTARQDVGDDQSRLVARILESGKALWEADRGADSAMPGRGGNEFVQHGAAFGFPVHSRGKMIAVVELFATEVLVDRPRILDYYGQFSTQLGRVWEREYTHLCLQDSARRFEKISQISSDWVWETDAQLCYRFLSSGFESALDLKVSQWLGNTSASLTPTSHRQNEEFLEALHGRRAFKNIRHFVADACGQLRCLVSHGTPTFLDTTGGFSGYLGSSSDVTSLYETELELDRAKLEAERANLAKSDFLSSLSHDFRTPLNTIIGFSQLLDTDSEGPLSTKQKESVFQIIQAGKYLADLLGEVLELSRIESGKVELIIEHIPVRELVDSCVALLDPSARQRGVQIEIIVPEGDHGMFVGDSTRVHSVLVNLLSNAVKYSPLEGIVTIQFDAMADQCLRLSVTDSGIGISESQWQRVFEPFDRLGAQRSAIGGTGIGLSISKKLVELMGGKIGFDSEVGIGSTFWFELPSVALPGTRVTVRHETQVLDNFRFVADQNTRYTVLYVEDNAGNLALMERVVADVGNLELRTAVDAETALVMIATHPPDLVLMDINLPGESGIDAIRKIRANSDLESRPRIPVLALSAVALRTTIDEAISAGFDAYLIKPLNARETLLEISQALAVRSEGDPGEGMGSSAD